MLLEGDSLWRIAKEVYAEGKRYVELIEKNSIHDKLRIGQEIRLCN